MIVSGIVRVPGDKSITHRALLLAALADGESVLGGALASLDTRTTGRVLRQLGIELTPLRPDSVVRVLGRRRFLAPERTLHCGNSGTTTRLLLGLLAAHRFAVILTGDASLRRRPMRRVTEPLRSMGAWIDDHEHDGLPLSIRGGALRPLRYAMPVASAQVKSALLLAGLAGGVPVSLREPSGVSRDHTERLLQALGFDLSTREGWIHFQPGARLTPFIMQVPGDISSAMFLIGAALLAEGGTLELAGTGLNPTRTGMLDVLSRMGASLQIQVEREELGEPVGTIQVRPGTLAGTKVNPDEIPGIIDEIPMLAVLATRAVGVTTFRRAGELRVKESDRLGLLARNIRAVGGRAEVQGEDLVIEGLDYVPRGRVTTASDHRLAMAFQVLGTVAGARVTVDDPECAAVSFPGFDTILRAIRARRHG